MLLLVVVGVVKVLVRRLLILSGQDELRLLRRMRLVWSWHVLFRLFFLFFVLFDRQGLPAVHGPLGDGPLARGGQVRRVGGGDVVGVPALAGRGRIGSG